MTTADYEMADQAPRSYLIFDCETVPDVDLVTRVFGLEEGLNITEVERQALDILNARSNFERTMLPVHLQRLAAVAAGVMKYTADEGLKFKAWVQTCETPAGEMSALKRFWRAAQNQILVSYNGRCFDLPLIELRSLHHMLAVPWYFESKTQNYKQYRYRYTDRAQDLADFFTNHGALRPMPRLDHLLQLIGMPGKIGGVDGSQVGALVDAGDLVTVGEYCMLDVVQTAILFLRAQVLKGYLVPEVFAPAVRSVFDWYAGAHGDHPLAAAFLDAAGHE